MTRPGLEPTIHHAQGKHAFHCTTDMINMIKYVENQQERSNVKNKKENHCLTWGQNWRIKLPKVHRKVIYCQWLYKAKTYAFWPLKYHSFGIKQYICQSCYQNILFKHAYAHWWKKHDGKSSNLFLLHRGSLAEWQRNLKKIDTNVEILLNTCMIKSLTLTSHTVHVKLYLWLYGIIQYHYNLHQWLFDVYTFKYCVHFHKR